MRITIIGGGIGGPAAAIGLAQNGHAVTLYERAASLEGVGFAFRITPNSDRCLKHLGIDTVDGGAVTANTSRMMDHRGNVTFENRENTDPDKAKKGTSVFAYRVCNSLTKFGILLTVRNSHSCSSSCSTGRPSVV
jgi:2-polyprenyl-6-methoxyphenol hydroxylase-like FAD-dependent oxidoreductase